MILINNVVLNFFLVDLRVAEINVEKDGQYVEANSKREIDNGRADLRVIGSCKNQNDRSHCCNE